MQFLVGATFRATAKAYLPIQRPSVEDCTRLVGLLEPGKVGRLRGEVGRARKRSQGKLAIAARAAQSYSPWLASRPVYVAGL